MIHEGTEGGCLDGFIEVRILKHDERRLAAQFKQARLQVFGRPLRNDLANTRGTGEVDSLHRGMIDQRAHHLSSILRLIGDHVHDACRKTRCSERFNDQAVRPGADLRGFQDH